MTDPNDQKKGPPKEILKNTELFSFELPKAMKERLKIWCGKNDLNMAQAIRKGIRYIIKTGK